MSRPSQYDPCHFDRDFALDLDGSPVHEKEYLPIPSTDGGGGGILIPNSEGGRQATLGREAAHMLDIPSTVGSTKCKSGAEIRFSRARKRIWSKTSVGLLVPGRYFFLPSPRHWMRHGPFKRVGRFYFYACGVKGTLSTILAYEPMKAMVSFTSLFGYRLASIWQQRVYTPIGLPYTAHLNFELRGCGKRKIWRLTSRNRALVQLVRRKISGTRLRSRQTFLPSLSPDGGFTQDGKRLLGRFGGPQ